MSAGRMEKLRFLRELSNLGREWDARDGMVVVEEGGEAGAVFFILEGEFEVLRGKVAVGVMREGAMFGEFAALTGGRRNATVVCRGMGRLLEVSAEDFRAVLHRQPELVLGMYQDLAGKVFGGTGGAGRFLDEQLVNFDSATVLEALEERRVARGRCWEKIGVWGDRSCGELEKYLHCHNCPVYEDAGRGMLDRAATSEYLAENRRMLEEERKAGRGVALLRMLPFRLDEEWFALRAGFFTRIVHPRRVQKIPHREGGILTGIVVIHGEIHLHFDMRRLLEVEAAGLGVDWSDARRQPRQAIIGPEGNVWVFSADEFGAVDAVREDAITPAPVTLEKATANFTRGLVECGGRRVALLDEDLLLYRLGKECE